MIKGLPVRTSALNPSTSIPLEKLSPCRTELRREAKDHGRNRSRLGKSSEVFRVEAILDVWTIDANQDDGPATLDGNLCVWAERNIYHPNLSGRGFDSLRAFISSRDRGCQARQTGECAKRGQCLEHIAPFGSDFDIHSDLLLHSLSRTA
jgi:hypothetical protein